MIDAQTEQALQNLINGIESTEEIELLRQKLSAGQISIGGDANNSVIILGDGNTVNQYQLTPEMLDALTRRKLAASVPLRNPIVEGINLLPYDYDQKIQNFLKEYLGDEQHPIPFGGRDDALQMLDGWLLAEITPYLLLAAPAGRGKSALLVRWLGSLSSREDLALAFIPVSIRFGTNMERVFYAALAARLAFLHDDDVPASPETSTAVYRGLVSDYLSKPLANRRTLLVVLDGLDEAADWQAGADFMPSELPTGVRVVVSARFLAGDADSISWLRRLNWERSGLTFTPSLVPLNRAGVADVLLKMGCPLDELSRDVDIVAELYRLSEGDPLLVSLYVGDLWARGAEATRLKPEDLAGIQPGYKGYFDRWWDDQKKLWGKKKPWLQRYISTAQNLLAGALGPLFIADIQALSPKLTSRHIADALDVLQRFIIGNNKTDGYTFSHPKLGQYFWDALTPTEQAQVEGRFLIWSEQTLQEFIDGKRDAKKKAEVPTYMIRNYGAHLARARRPIDDWLPIIHQQAWAQAWLSVEGAYGGYLQDVERVCERCRALDEQKIETNGKAPYFGEQIRCGLIEASLHTLAGNIPSKLIWPLVRDDIWTLPQAISTIRQMPKVKQQVEAIFTLLAHIEDKHLLQVLDIVRAIPDNKYRALLLCELAQRMPKVVEEALVAAWAIQDDADRAEVLSNLSGQSLEAANGALTAVTAIQSEMSRAQILGVLAKKMQQETLEQILIAARAIQNERHRTRLLIELAQRMPEVVEEALVAASAIQGEEDRAEALSNLAGQSLEAANAALTAIMAIRGEMSRARMLGILAKRIPQEALGKILIAVQAIRDEWYRASVLSILAERMLQEELGQILTAARAIRNAGARTQVLSALMQRMPEIIGEALVAARATESESELIGVWTSLAKRSPEASDEVLAAMQTIEHNREDILCSLIQKLREKQWPEITREALITVQLISDKANHAFILSVLTHWLPDVGMEALTTAQDIRDGWERARALSNMTQHMPDVVGEALAAVQATRPLDVCANLFILLVRCLPEAKLEQVLDIISIIRSEEEYVVVLIILAERLPKNKLGRLLVTVRRNLDSWDDEQSLAAVLSELAQRAPDDELKNVLTAARMIHDKESRARVLIALKQRRPKADTALAIRNKENLIEVFSKPKTLAQRSRKEDYSLIEKTLHQVSVRTRADLLSDLTALMPIIVQLGTDDTPREIYQAVRDVTTWWP